LALNISETVRDRDVVIMDLHVPYASVICFDVKDDRQHVPTGHVRIRKDLPYVVAF